MLQSFKGAEQIALLNAAMGASAVEIGRKGHHLRTADSFAIAMDHTGIATTLGGGIGEVHHPSVADIGTGNVLAHVTDLGFLEDIEAAAGSVGKDLKIVVHLAGRMPPVGRTFLAGTVVLRIINEFFGRCDGFLHAFSPAFGIGFHQQKTGEGVEIAPGVPVVDHLIRIARQRHPPVIRTGKIGIEHAIFHLLADACGDNRVHLVEGS